MLKINVKLLSDTAKIPTRATEGSIGYDVSSDETVTLEPGEIKLVSTGISIEPNIIVGIMMYPRSGLSCKHGITLINSVAVIDPDYRGEIKVPLINNGKFSYTINKGDRISQLVFHNIMCPQINEVSEFSIKTDRNENGFGSTGK